MPKYKEYRFTINGKIGDEDFTPLTIPMSRLAEYLTDLAKVLGHKESVHLLKVEEGSTAPMLFIDAEEESRIIHRAQAAQRGQSVPEANEAFKRLDMRAREDQGYAQLEDVEKKANIIEFPGARLNRPEEYGPIRERISVIGRVMRVGGFGDTIPVWLERLDKEVFYCEADDLVSTQISKLYRQYIRVHGIATLVRDVEGKWKRLKFKIQSFDPEPLSDESIIETIAKLRAIPGGWSEIENPLEEIRKIRRGEDEPKQ